MRQAKGVTESDLEASEANVFFPPGFTNTKPNILSRTIFNKAVAEVGMSYAHDPQFSIPDDADPENPSPVCFLDGARKPYSRFKLMRG